MAGSLLLSRLQDPLFRVIGLLLTLIFSFLLFFAFVPYLLALYLPLLSERLWNHIHAPVSHIASSTTPKENPAVFVRSRLFLFILGSLLWFFSVNVMFLLYYLLYQLLDPNTNILRRLMLKIIKIKMVGIPMGVLLYGMAFVCYGIFVSFYSNYIGLRYSKELNTFLDGDTDTGHQKKSYSPPPMTLSIIESLLFLSFSYIFYRKTLNTLHSL